MTSTAQLELPLLQPSQAQKHVTVNEALARLDAMAALVLVSRGLSTPPEGAGEGEAYGVPAAAGGAWAGQGGRIALRANGGWVFLPPRRGWRAWIADEGAQAIHDGTTWRSGAVALSASGSGSFLQVLEFDHALTSGTGSNTAQTIPANVLVMAVTARVIATIGGTLPSWRLGNPGAVTRFGSGLGLEVGSFAHGLLSTPMAFHAATELRLTPTSGSFNGTGAVRLAVHYFEASLPEV